MRSEKGPNILITKSRNYYYYKLRCLILALVSDIFFITLLGRAFQNDEEWRLFYFNSITGCRVVRDFALCKLDDL